MFFIIDKTVESVSKGSSKLFGAPDVNADFEWPYIVDDNVEVDLEFLGQFNCNEISSFCPEAKKSGMIYVFIDPLVEKLEPSNKDAVRIVVSNSTVDELDYIDSIDQNGNSIGVSEFAIKSVPLVGSSYDGEMFEKREDTLLVLSLSYDVLLHFGLDIGEGNVLEISSDLDLSSPIAEVKRK